MKYKRYMVIMVSPYTNTTRKGNQKWLPFFYDRNTGGWESESTPGAVFLFGNDIRAMDRANQNVTSPHHVDLGLFPERFRSRNFNNKYLVM